MVNTLPLPASRLRRIHHGLARGQSSTGRGRRLRAYCYLRGMQALGEEMTFRLITGQHQRRSEMVLRRFAPLAAKLELSERGPVERIRSEAIRIGDRLDLLDSPTGPSRWAIAIARLRATI